jgi:hypothetical protein
LHGSAGIAFFHQSILWIMTAVHAQAGYAPFLPPERSVDHNSRAWQRRDSTPFFHQAFCDHDSSELAWQRRDSTPSSTEHSVNHNSSELAWQRRDSTPSSAEHSVDHNSSELVAGDSTPFFHQSILWISSLHATAQG